MTVGLSLCQQQTHCNWPDIETRFLPIIKAKASKIWRCYQNMDVHDAIQEGRIALLLSLKNYDETRGKLEPYVNRVLDNTYNGILHKNLRQKSMPQAIVFGDKGRRKKMPSLNLLSLDALVSDDVLEPLSSIPSPEEYIETAEKIQLIRKFRLQMYKKFKKNTRHVFFCRTNPSSAFLKMVQDSGGNINKPSNVLIARFLGLNKNAVDYSLLKIKKAFIELSSTQKFSDLFADTI